VNLSNCESVKGAFFKIMGFAGKRFLFSPPLPLPAASISVAHAQFLRLQKAKNALNGWPKTLRKRLLRRLQKNSLRRLTTVEGSSED